MSEIHTLSVKALVKLIHKRELMASEGLDAFIRRVDIVNPQINALINTNFDNAKQLAFEADQKLKNSNFLSAPLLGIPFTVKDLYSIPDFMVTFGTKGLADTVCHQETTVITRLVEQGSILLGLTNTPELGVSLETDNPSAYKSSQSRGKTN